MLVVRRSYLTRFLLTKAMCNLLWSSDWCARSENGWEENNGDYIPAVTANAFALCFLVELISCNCKKRCKKCCSCHSNRQNYTDMCGCGEFCQSEGHALPTQNSTWRGSPTSRGTLLIFNSHAEIFWEIAVLK